MPKSKPMRWLIMPPAADQSLWESAIGEAAQKSDLKLTIGNVPAKDSNLVLTQNAEQALKAGAKGDDMVVLLSEAGFLPPELAGSGPNVDRHGKVMAASQLLLEALKLSDVRRVTARQVASGPVALFKDLSLHLPVAAPVDTGRRNKALLAATSLYEEDQATWSTDILDIYAQITARTASSQTLDATGKPRFLIHGPYLFMPKGSWKVKARLEFEKALCDKKYAAHWGGVQTYSSLEFKPEHEGLYQLEMDWTWETAAPCEFRLIVQEAVFDGELKVHDLEISRLD
jgi:hypothetical protein